MRKISAFLAILLVFVGLPEMSNAASLTIGSATTATDGSSVILAFQNPAAAATWTVRRPPGSDFMLVGSAQGSIAITSVSPGFYNGTLTLVTSSRIRPTQQLKLSYAPSLNVPLSDTNEPLAAFTDLSVNNLVSSLVPNFSSAYYANDLSGSYIRFTFGISDDIQLAPIPCDAGMSNFELLLNGRPEPISVVSKLYPSANGIYCGAYRLALTTAIPANTLAQVRYLTSPGKMTNEFGGAVPSSSWVSVSGVADTIPATITTPASFTFSKGSAAIISLTASEEVGWNIVQDSTLQFRVSDDQRFLIISSVLPVGTYSVQVRATDNAGNETLKSISIQILELTPSPTATPTPSSSPKPVESAKPSGSPIVSPKKVPVFKNCTTLNKAYPSGIAKSYLARNRGKALSRIPLISSIYYLANAKLDVDKDGIVCEK